MPVPGRRSNSPNKENSSNKKSLKSFNNGRTATTPRRKAASPFTPAAPRRKPSTPGSASSEKRPPLTEITPEEKPRSKPVQPKKANSIRAPARSFSPNNVMGSMKSATGFLGRSNSPKHFVGSGKSVASPLLSASKAPPRSAIDKKTRKKSSEIAKNGDPASVRPNGMKKNCGLEAGSVLRSRSCIVSRRRPENVVETPRTAAWTRKEGNSVAADSRLVCSSPKGRAIRANAQKLGLDCSSPRSKGFRTVSKSNPEQLGFKVSSPKSRSRKAVVVLGCSSPTGKGKPNLDQKSLGYSSPKSKQNEQNEKFPRDSSPKSRKIQAYLLNKVQCGSNKGNRPSEFESRFFNQRLATRYGNSAALPVHNGDLDARLGHGFAATKLGDFSPRGVDSPGILSGAGPRDVSSCRFVQAVNGCDLTPAPRIVCRAEKVDFLPTPTPTSTSSSTPEQRTQVTPPVQPSLSPEIHSQIQDGKEEKDAKMCFGAGHVMAPVVGKVKDRRKCRPRGILIAGEAKALPLPVEEEEEENRRFSLVPEPAVASVQWMSSMLIPPGGVPGRSVDEQSSKKQQGAVCSETSSPSNGFRSRSPASPSICSSPAFSSPASCTSVSEKDLKSVASMAATLSSGFSSRSNTTHGSQATSQSQSSHPSRFGSRHSATSSRAIPIPGSSQKASVLCSEHSLVAACEKQCPDFASSSSMSANRGHASSSKCTPISMSPEMENFHVSPMLFPIGVSPELERFSVTPPSSGFILEGAHLASLNQEINRLCRLQVEASLDPCNYAAEQLREKASQVDNGVEVCLEENVTSQDSCPAENGLDSKASFGSVEYIDEETGINESLVKSHISASSGLLEEDTYAKDLETSGDSDWTFWCQNKLHEEARPP